MTQETPIFDREILLKSQIHSTRIERLINKIDKEFKKKFNGLSEPNTFFENSLGKISHFRKFYSLYSICLVEICNDIQFFGLNHICILLLKLFNCFKLHLVFFMKYNSEFLNMRNVFHSDIENELKELKIVYEVEIQTLKKFGLNKYEETQIGLSKKRIDKYERMEKSKFYFQQEEIELEKMAFEMNGGQKEIENCLRNERMIMEKTGPAGTKQILMAILRNLKTSNNFQDFDEETLDKLENNHLIKFEIIKNEFLLKVDETSKKAFIKYLVASNSKKSDIDKETQTDYIENFENLEKNDQKLFKSNKKGLKTQKILRKSLFDNNEMDTEREDYELNIKKLREKLASGDDKYLLLKNIKDDQDFKLYKKKTKVKSLKEELEILKGKLEIFESEKNEKKALEKLQKIKENEDHFKEDKFKLKLDEYTESIKIYEEKHQLLTQKNHNQKEKIIALQTELDQIKQLMDLLQEKKNFENNQPLALNKNPSQPPSPTKLKTQGSSKFSFDNLKIQTDTPKSNKNALTKKISGVISDKSAFIKQKIESVQQIPIPIITLKNEEKIFKEIKQPAGDLSPKMKVLPEISPKSKSKKNISQTTIHSKSPKTKSKNKTIKPIQVKSQEKINHNNQNDVQPNIPIKSFLEFSNPIMESKECNTEFVEFLSFLNFGEKLSDILENIDFSNENVRNHFEKIFEQYIKNSRNKINDNSEKVISKNDVGLQTEIDILFIPTIENVSTQNIDGITIETLYTNKKPEFYQFQLESDEIFNTRKSLNNLDFSHQENQNIIPNNKKNNSEIYENSLSFHEKFNKISQKLSNDQIQQKNPQIPFPILENSEILSYSKSKAYLPQKSKAENIHKNTNRTHNFDKKMEERRSNKIYEKLESKSMEDLPMGYSSNRKLTEFRELRKNEAIEEEDEQYINAKEVFEHLYKNSEVNFSKIKYMFNYPFKKIEDFSARKKTENLEEKFLTNKDNLNFETFKALFDRLIQAHIKCGKNCKHLKRFYKNIGFGMGSNKKEFYISKKIISRLPKI